MALLPMIRMFSQNHIQNKKSHTHKMVSSTLLGNGLMKNLHWLKREILEIRRLKSMSMVSPQQIRMFFQNHTQSKRFHTQQMVSSTHPGNGLINQPLLHKNTIIITTETQRRTLVTRRLMKEFGALLQMTEMFSQLQDQDRKLHIQGTESSTQLGNGWISLKTRLRKNQLSLNIIITVAIITPTEILETRRSRSTSMVSLLLIKMFSQNHIQSKRSHIHKTEPSIHLGNGLMSHSNQLHWLNHIQFLYPKRKTLETERLRSTYMVSLLLIRMSFQSQDGDEMFHIQLTESTIHHGNGLVIQLHLLPKLVTIQWQGKQTLAIRSMSDLMSSKW